MWAAGTAANHKVRGVAGGEPGVCHATSQPSIDGDGRHLSSIVSLVLTRNNPKRCRPDVTGSVHLHPTKQALSRVILRQMGRLGPSMSLPKGL